TRRTKWCLRISAPPMLADRHHLPARGRLGAEVGPGIHQPPPLLELVAALVCLLSVVADAVRERDLDGLVGEVGALARPRLERRAEAMRSDVAAPHALEHLEQRHVRRMSFEH